MSTVTLVPADYSRRTVELAESIRKMLNESEADLSECANAALCVLCAIFATSGGDTADLVQMLSESISLLITGIREDMARRDTMN